MRPRKKPSNLMTPANASRLRTLGAARRSNVGRIGPSSSILVRAATAEEAAAFAGVAGGAGVAIGAGQRGEGESAMDGSVIGAPPNVGLEQRLRRTVFKNRVGLLQRLRPAEPQVLQ